jgi:hypothetical protein
MLPRKYIAALSPPRMWDPAIYNARMTPVQRARQFAQIAYAAAVSEIIREFDRKRHAAQVRLATRGGVVRLDTSEEEAKLDGEQIDATIKARLYTLLDGYELNGIPIDDDVTMTILVAVSRSLDLATALPSSLPGTGGWASFTKRRYREQVNQHIGISLAWILTEIDRRRSEQKSPPTGFTAYQVEDDSTRLDVGDGNDCMSALIKDNEGLFTIIRQKIEYCLPEGPEKAVIQRSFTALENARDIRSFVVCYIAFLSAAANHIVLFTPCIPALNEMVNQALRCDHRDRVRA